MSKAALQETRYVVKTQKWSAVAPLAASVTPPDSTQRTMTSMSYAAFFSRRHTPPHLRHNMRHHRVITEQRDTSDSIPSPSQSYPENKNWTIQMLQESKSSSSSSSTGGLIVDGRKPEVRQGSSRCNPRLLRTPDAICQTTLVAYQVILEPCIGQFHEFEPYRVHTRVTSLGLLLAHKLTCGKRESVS